MVRPYLKRVYFDLAALQGSEIQFSLADDPPILKRTKIYEAHCPNCDCQLTDTEQGNHIVLICEPCRLVWLSNSPPTDISMRRVVGAWIPPTRIRSGNPKYHRNYMKHRQKRLAYAAIWAANNRDSLRRTHRAYYEANRERLLEYARNWWQNKKQQQDNQPGGK